MPFVKGQSGNPGGRPKEDAEIKALARSYAPECIHRLARIALDSENERAATTAAVALLDRGFGKPKQEVEHSNPDGSGLMQGLAVTFVKPNDAD